MSAKAERAALERVFEAARRMRDTWRGAYHADAYIRSVNAVAKTVDRAEAAIAKAQRPKATRKRAHR